MRKRKNLFITQKQHTFNIFGYWNKKPSLFKKNIITQTDGLLNELLTDLNPNKTYS